ncbi:hypothetical protein [Mesorhizobium sp.]|uniref:hypothetical protein n=1 Tax=Mesorhizobium sp. TaxID=1871066 RepID=UPI000FE83882|nr:hypothetical protein [Mesorhizobium sp.]RWH31626.1 MAG: hypothetical protein EOQ76_07370 [Mesorhizobium sp.]TIR57679.1 MAG: hypothetical protein E5X22_22920 [Mesorhizobium sp.]
MTKLHERPNRATPSEAASFIEEFDRIEQDREEKLRVLDAEFKAKKRAIQKIANDDQKSILEDAKKQGVNKGVVRAIVDAQKLKRKAEAMAARAENKIDGLEDDDRDFAIDIRTALGDDFASFGLGAAAVSREDADDEEDDEQDDTTAAVVDAVRAGASKEEWDGAGAKH